MPHMLAAPQRALLLGVAVLRSREDHHTGESTGTQLISELFRVRRVVGVLRPAHRGALRAMAFQRVGQRGGQHIGGVGGADQQPRSGVGVVRLGQLSLLPFDGQQPLVQHPIVAGRCSETPVPIRSPCTVSSTVPCSSSTSRSASTPAASAVVTRV